MVGGVRCFAVIGRAGKGRGLAVRSGVRWWGLLKCHTFYSRAPNNISNLFKIASALYRAFFREGFERCFIF